MPAEEREGKERELVLGGKMEGQPASWVWGVTWREGKRGNQGNGKWEMTV